MTTIAKRLTALEQVAEDMRLRPIRELAAERGIPFATLMRNYQDIHARNQRLRAQGLTQPQIVAATAERLGISVETLQADCDQLVERFGLHP